MSLETRLQNLAVAIGDDIQILLAGQGALSSLNTTAKTSLVAAINEVLAGTPAGVLLVSNNLSDLGNAATSRTNLDVRSSGEVTSEITAAIAAVTLASLGGLTQAEVDARVQLLVDTAPAALDTLAELSAALGDDENFATTMTNSLGDRVSFASAQSKTTAEILQACQNMGIGNPERDLVGDYETARDS